MIRVGFVSAILADRSFAEVMAFAGEAGYACVEIMCWPSGKAERRYAGVTHIDVTALKKVNIEEIHRVVEQTGVRISGLGYYPNPLTADREQSRHFIAHLKKVIDGADKLGLQHVNTFIGRDHRTSVEANFKRFRKIWPPIIRHAEKRGVTIGIENCPMYFSEDEWPGGKNLATTPALWRRMFEEIPSPSFGLNYDPSHMIWQFMDYIKPIYEFRERIVHVHIKDARIRYDLLNEVGIMAPPLQFHQPKLPGLGDVDWGAFFAALTDIGYRGSACVEVEDRAYEGTLKDRKRALRQSLGYVRQFV